MRISDISVSRVHAIIKFNDGKFFIFDNTSKFGTLIHVNKPFPITTEKIAIQVGKTVLTLILKNPVNSHIIGPKLYANEENNSKLLPKTNENENYEDSN